jgi:hypothetical protein
MSYNERWDSTKNQVHSLSSRTWQSLVLEMRTACRGRTEVEHLLYWEVRDRISEEIIPK